MGLFKWINKSVDKLLGREKVVKIPVSKPVKVEKYRDVFGDYVTPKRIGKLDPMYKGQFVPYNTRDGDRKIYVLFAKTGAGEVYYEPGDPGMVSTYYKGTNYTNDLLKQYGWSLDEMVETVCAKQLERGDSIVGFLHFQND